VTVIKMMKVTVLVHEDDAEELLEAIQEAGVLHVAPIGEEIPFQEHGGSGDAVDRYEHMDRLVHALASVAPASTRLQVDEQPLPEVIARLDELVLRRERLEKALNELDDHINELKHWGDIDPLDIRFLRESGISVTFATVTREQWNLLDKKEYAFAISRETDETLWVVFFDATPPMTPIELPNTRLPVLQDERDSVMVQIGRTNRDMGRYAHFSPLLENRMAGLRDRVALLEALDITHVDTPLVALRGYVPRRESLEVQIALAEYNAVFLMEEPSGNDQVPVMLKNNWFFSGFEAVLKTFSGLSYREKDMTWMVGLLFIVFGSLCLLDAGYGLLLMVTGIILRLRGERAFSRVFTITGLFTIPLGGLSGQAFGLIQGKDFLINSQPLFPLATDPLASFNFSLIVGAVAMAFSYMIAIWQRGWRTHSLGSLCLVLAAGGFAMAGPGWPAILSLLGSEPTTQVLASYAAISTQVGFVLLVLALLSWILFPEPVFGSSRLPNVIWTLYAGSTGLIQDVLSHMRLFGIALSGSILALVVNQIGAQFPLVITVLFAIVGHIFVFVLALLSLYIHANRLIFLEVGSKCIDGGHLYYQPLQRGVS